MSLFWGLGTNLERGLHSSLLVRSARTLVAPNGKPDCGGAMKTIATSSALFKPDMGRSSSAPLVPPVVSSCVAVLLDSEPTITSPLLVFGW